MNESVRESTKEKGEFGELYAIIEVLDDQIHYIYSDIVFEVTNWENFEEIELLEYRNVEGKDTAIRGIRGSEDVIYRNEEVLSDSDILASTI
ncbi:hypothetical protein [Halorubrum ezzemoulense]|uniref:hypothetical protein n=1 Tax=Halorubrum ezzemoulense TaxID=337243 RepID=UPI0011407056|nr:hypothetical protein [Halorubrum ezzemoulense]